MTTKARRGRIALDVKKFAEEQRTKASDKEIEKMKPNTAKWGRIKETKRMSWVVAFFLFDISLGVYLT